MSRDRRKSMRAATGNAEEGLPSPEAVRAEFDRLRAQDPERALAWLHGLELSCGYLDAGAEAERIRWTGGSAWGDLECSINLAKPEKDPRDIAAAGGAGDGSGRGGADAAGGAGVPRCDLCWENEGFPGCPGHPAKPGLRIAAIELGGERWGLQYSPYAYFPEHCIALSERHRPLRVDAACLARLLDFVDAFPCYFIAANADLPLVGGSILSHDHYQGGRCDFPLMRAPAARPFPLAGFPDLEVEVLRWPASTLRLRGRDRGRLLDAAARILDVWRGFSWEPCGILPESARAEGARERHNAVSAIARREGDGGWTLWLVLRNNRRDAEHPWGLFHPGPELHHIKKENIGVIEIMGLAILPPRLARELPQVQDVLLRAARGGASPEEAEAELAARADTAPHAPWAADVLARRADGLRAPGPATGASGLLHPVIEDELARSFAAILEATGVFKDDAAGRAGWEAFARAVDGGPGEAR